MYSVDDDDRFIFASIASGIACGILGLTGLRGLAAHCGFMLATGAAVASVKCEGKPSSYFPSIDKVFIDGPHAGFGTFVLFWTLSYNCAHLF